MTMTIQNFIEQNKIKMSCEYADSNPNMADSANMNHYKCQLRRSGKQLTINFSQGYGISGDPEVESVLSCLASDSIGVENAGNFEDWAQEYGYDTDNRKAEKIYKVCERQSQKLKNFLGEELYGKLLWETEQY